MNHRRILIFKPGAIGDLLHMTPVVRALKGVAPEATITMMVGSRITASIFDGNPCVDDILLYDKKGEQRSWKGLFSLRRRVREGGYDLVLNYQRSNLKGWFVLSAAFPCRVLVYHKTRRETVHAVVDHLRPLAPLGIDPESVDRRLDFFPSSDDESFADRYLLGQGLAGKRVVAFNPGTSSPNKCWPVERFAELGNRLVELLGCAVVVVGSREEADLGSAIAAGMRWPVHDLCGCTLGQLGAILKRCRILVTGDTGPMHVASAVGTPVLALYGPISPLRSGPVGEGHRILLHSELSCVPCNSFTCRHEPFRECMELITVDEAFRAVMEMLGRPAGDVGHE